MLARLIATINTIIPPMKFKSPTNPNNGKPHHTYLIGNEGSRVIYLVIRKFYLKKEFQGKAFDYDDLAAKLDTLAEQAHADEYGVTRDTKDEFIYRFWWD